MRDDNITSVGIGYKEKDGKVTDKIAIQFSVEKKLEPDKLESEGSGLQIPESFVINGVQVPTDVIQRDYNPEFETEE